MALKWRFGAILGVLGLLSPIASDAAHPAFTDDAGTLNPGQWELEIVSEGEITEDDDAFGFSLRHGIRSGLDFGISTYGWKAGPGVDREWFGAVDLKWRPVDGGARLPSPFVRVDGSFLAHDELDLDWAGGGLGLSWDLGTVFVAAEMFSEAADLDTLFHQDFSGVRATTSVNTSGRLWLIGEVVARSRSEDELLVGAAWTFGFSAVSAGLRWGLDSDYRIFSLGWTIQWGS